MQPEIAGGGLATFQLKGGFVCSIDRKSIGGQGTRGGGGGSIANEGGRLDTA